MAKRSTSRSKAAPQLTGDTRILAIYGPEPALIRQKIDQLKAAITDAHGEFETYTLDGKTATLADVFDELRSYSLMQTYKLVVVHDADAFVKTHRAALERYAAEPVDHATLVLRADKWNRGNLDKAIAKVGAVIKCDHLKPGDAEAWLVERAKATHQCAIKCPASTMLIERVGTDLGQLDSELAKLAVMVGQGGEVTAAIIDEAVGRGSDAQAWAVQEAVLEAMARRRPGQAIGALREIIDLAGQPDVLVAYFVADLVRKLNVAAAMKQAGEPDASIGRALKLFGPRQRVFFDVLRSQNPSTLADWFDRIVTLDQRSKTGLGTAGRNLEAFCVGLTDR